MSRVRVWGWVLSLAAAAAACGGGGGGSQLSALSGCSLTSVAQTSTITFATRPEHEFISVTETDYTASSYTRTFTSLQPTENLFVIAMNTRSIDPVSIQFTVTGLSPSQPRAQTSARLAARDRPARAAAWLDRLAAGEARVRALVAQSTPGRLLPTRESWRALAAEPVVGSASSFWIVTDFATGSQAEITAILRVISPHAYIYVHDVDSGGIDTALLADLAARWESTIYPRLIRTFGTEPDVDGNGRVILLLSHRVGDNGALGFFFTPDLSADDPTASFRSNQAEILYITTPAAANITTCEASAELLPAILAHELQHLINFNQHVLVRKGLEEETWADEGLAMLAQDVAGYGHTIGDVASRIAYYLRFVDDFSLTIWENHPAGNYGGSYLFFRYLADQLGEAIVGPLVQTIRVGEANVEFVTGTPFSDLERDWRVALALSHTAIVPVTSARQYHFSTLNPNDYFQVVPGSYHVGLAWWFGGGTTSFFTRAHGAHYIFMGSGTGADVTVTVTSGLTPRLVIIRH